MRMTQAQYLDYITRQRRASSGTNSESPDLEKELHQQIINECRRRVWPCFHGSMAHRTYRTPGEPDFIIAASGGRTFYVEAKTRMGKLTPDQRAINHWLCEHGHHYAVVRNFREFLELIR